MLLLRPERILTQYVRDVHLVPLLRQRVHEVDASSHQVHVDEIGALQSQAECVDYAGEVLALLVAGTSIHSISIGLSFAVIFLPPYDNRRLAFGSLPCLYTRSAARVAATRCHLAPGRRPAVFVWP